ncbi:MAG: hypothetical protein IPP00_00655 [Actinomycetales bacterium]|uniref:Uncharacterized protein n=1 Tax=Candidatus Phosphoribacter hodrii TaxID=2953743 RepID=A0A9D7T7U8_9MICO|nr:hypothetical protein [Candidatus Phosphoribacter hodrii]
MTGSSKMMGTPRLIEAGTSGLLGTMTAISAPPSFMTALLWRLELAGVI